MESFKLSLMLVSLLPFLVFNLVAAEEEELGTYIIHVQPPENQQQLLGVSEARKAFHQSFLPRHGRLLHSYRHVASGFAARLTRRELEAISAMPGFVAAVPDVTYQVQTTYSPRFLGLDTSRGTRNLTLGSGEGVIIGVLDTGVFPFHPSFSGDGMPPPPAKWKGRCDLNGSQPCNNKLIGARNFVTGNSSSAGRPPTDETGHGTHTASTAAGAVVPGAQALEQASGIASGTAPRAHVAVYKVCGKKGCPGVDVLAGIDAAVSDGCDVISLSLGGPSTPFYNDSIAIGAFAAAEKGIFVSMSGGNSGPLNSTLSNEAPWVLTVAASTMDRLILSTVILGDGVSFDGQSLYHPAPNASEPLLYPLVYAGASTRPEAQFCGNGSLEGLDVRGKIVLCDRGNGGRVDKGAEVLRAGGAGMILANQLLEGYTTDADAHLLPASHVSFFAGQGIKGYIKSTPNPEARISFAGGTALGTSQAPAMAAFSSRGPNIQSPGILKPDITGPGVSVLAAWPFQVGPPRPFDPRPTFNVISGTSMSAPHLSGIAALIKSKHPGWSSAEIKSAIMTTADVTDRSGTAILNEQRMPADFFAFGAGHVNAGKAVDPGLVFHISTDDYIGYLCGLYTDHQVSVIARRRVRCAAITVIPEYQLNYPSISVSFGPDWRQVTPKWVYRTAKNVGEEPAVYYPHVDMPANNALNVSVFPSSLSFTEANHTQRFGILVSPTGRSATTVQGAVRWVSERHTVRIPISASFAAH